jgi:Cu(I)/Ag(I) efflux system membrane fusion protein
MRILNKINKDGFRTLIHKFRSVPVWVWILVIAAFLLGVVIRGGGSSKRITESSDHIHDEKQVEWWTCSMHPQIKLQEPGQCPICFMDLIPVETEDSGDIPTELKMSPAAMKLAEISTALVRRGAAEVKIQLSGKVAIDESRLGKITAWVPGRLEKLYVNYTGISVNRGDPLVELYSPDLYVAQAELLQALRYTQEAESNLARESARITLEASREKLSQLGLSANQISEIETRGTAVDRINIQSPVSGVVTHKNAIEGLYVAKGTKIYTIADLSQVWVVLDAYESDLLWMKEGQAVSFSVEAIPGRTFSGKVFFVDPILNEKTRTIEVRLNVDNTGKLLKPGMFVRATVQSITKRGKKGELPLLVPASAVLKTGKRAMVYIRKPDSEEPVFEGREIQLGARAGDEYIVLSGLEEGEKVVVKGNFKIDSAMQIAGKSSMMNPEGGMAVTGHEHHGQSETTESQQKEKDEIQHSEVGPDFLSGLEPIYSAYFGAQKALADDDFEAARNSLAYLDKNLENVKAGVLDNKKGKAWATITHDIRTMTQHARHWSDIQAVRSAFEPISYAILNLEKSFGHAGSETHYEVFCPMAFGGKGAPWLQNHDVVDNPYFGSKMLKCGEVRATYTGK